MLSYDEFCKELKDFLQKEMPDNEVIEQKTLLLNKGERDTLTLKVPIGEPNYAPHIYVKQFYDDYCRSGNEELDEIFSRVKQSLYNEPEITKTNLNNFKENVFLVVIGKEKNKELLETAVSRDVCDLSAVYRIYVGERSGGGILSATLTKKHLERLGFSEEELYPIALENTKRLFPPQILSIESEERFVRKTLEQIEPANDILLSITNDHAICGATTILYEETLHELAEKLNQDLFIFPSSIHEIIISCFDTQNVKVDDLKDIVRNINGQEDVLPPEEFLSNSVYVYDRESRSVMLADEREASLELD